MSIRNQNIASVMCAPLIHQDEVLGVIYVDTRGAASAFLKSDLDLLVALAGPAAIAIRNAQYVRKPDCLTDEEFAKMKIHPEKGARMMRDIPFLKDVIPYCLYHHERFDGLGYPFQLSGDKIPIEGRLIAVADTFDAMTSNRPYRKGMEPELAIAELEKGRGTQFDPECVDALLRCYREGKISSIMQDYMKDERSGACPFCSTYIKIPESAAVNTELLCDVCKRRVRLSEQNDALFLELV